MSHSASLKLFLGTVGNLQQCLLLPNAKEVLNAEYFKAFHQHSDESVARSWIASLPEIIVIAMKHGLANHMVVVELGFAVGSERIDLVLLGKTSGRKTLALIELKQWSKIKTSDDPYSLCVPNYDECRHPSYQVAGYEAKLRSIHGHMKEIDIFSCAFLHRLGVEDVEACSDGIYEPLVDLAPIYGANDADKLGRDLSAFLGAETWSEREIQDFLNEPARPSEELIEVIKNSGNQFKADAAGSLMGHGIVLTEEQLQVVRDVEKIMQSKERVCLLVEGKPGTGKTLVALTILMNALRDGKNARLGLANGKLNAVLKETLSVGGVCPAHFIELCRHGDGGLAYGNQKYDLLVFDEAQRLKSSEINSILNKAPIAIFIYDEDQRLQSTEAGTEINFRSSAKNLRIKVEKRKLSQNLRSSFGNAFGEWVDLLLQDPQSGKLRERPWQQGYVCEVCSSFADLKSKLVSQLTEHGREYFLCASFTKVNGREKPPKPRLPGPDPVFWLMPNRDYIDFWFKRNSKDLSRCASIYGSQGLERAICGFLWGKDLAIRNGQWCVQPDNEIEDDVGSPRLVDLVKSKDPSKIEEALVLLKNRCRIFLTRGMCGTYILCEDPETREFYEVFLRGSPNATRRLSP